MHRLANWQLFAVCVLTWGTTWHAVTYQVAAIAPEAGVALRFGLAGALVLAICRLRGITVSCRARDHAVLALQGAFLYGLSYVLVYEAERHIASGLVAVGYSASPLLAGLGARILFGTRVTGRFIVGGALGLAGVALIFAPELGAARHGDHVALGAFFTAAAVVLSSVGSLTASRNRTRGVPFWAGLGWGMVYGAGTCVLLGLARGESFTLPAAPVWWVTFAYLVLAGSIVTFAAFLALQDRIGPGPTGAIGVMTPLLALVVSIALEGFRPTLLTAAGAALAVLGNALMLRARRPLASPARAAAAK
jgi:drug/metabolite transporter (DMT)-like permease